MSALLRALARLVPRARRNDWIREWHAEVAFHDRLGHERGRGRTYRAITRGRLALDALEDAVGMWRRNKGGSAWALELRLAVRALIRSPLFALATTSRSR